MDELVISWSKTKSIATIPSMPLVVDPRIIDMYNRYDLKEMKDICLGLYDFEDRHLIDADINLTEVIGKLVSTYKFDVSEFNLTGFWNNWDDFYYEHSSASTTQEYGKELIELGLLDKSKFSKEYPWMY